MLSAGNVHLMDAIKTHGFLLFQLSLRQDCMFPFHTKLS